VALFTVKASILVESIASLNRSAMSENTEHVAIFREPSFDQLSGTKTVRIAEMEIRDRQKTFTDPTRSAPMFALGVSSLCQSGIAISKDSNYPIHEADFSSRKFHCGGTARKKGCAASETEKKR
jgi:hypothetical protein